MSRMQMPKGGNQDRRHGVYLGDEPIRGLQGANVPVIENVGKFVSGQAIFERMMTGHASQEKIEDARTARQFVGAMAVETEIHHSPDQQLPA